MSDRGNAAKFTLSPTVGGVVVHVCGPLVLKLSETPNEVSASGNPGVFLELRGTTLLSVDDGPFVQEQNRADDDGFACPDLNPPVTTLRVPRGIPVAVLAAGKIESPDNLRFSDQR